MAISSQAVPVVLAIGGHDPSGGAGIQADIEAIASQGCHAASVITCLTVQNTTNVLRIEPVADYLIQQQAETLLADMPAAGVKIGLLGSVDAVLVVHKILLQIPGIPVVFDPILAAGGGTALSDTHIIDAMREYLLPLTTLLTPNAPEAARLAINADTLDEQAYSLLDQGCGHVLLTGTHVETEQVENRLYAEGRCLRTWKWERLPGSYHGSGCTLASACAANLAKGMDIGKALGVAQAYAWGSLEAGSKLGHGQMIPNRFYWK